MIAADTSSVISYLRGETGPDIVQLDEALDRNELVLPPMVVTELFSDTKLRQEAGDRILSIPMMDIRPGFWIRAGRLRAKLRIQNVKLRVADALIAQMCLDYEISLFSRDRDFLPVVSLTGLRLIG